MEGFERQVNLWLGTKAETEEEAQAASDRWVQALMVNDLETVRRLMEAGTVRVTAADQSYPQPQAPEASARRGRDLSAFLAADEALRRAQDGEDTAPEALRTECSVRNHKVGALLARTP